MTRFALKKRKKKRMKDPPLAVIVGGGGDETAVVAGTILVVGVSYGGGRGGCIGGIEMSNHVIDCEEERMTRLCVNTLHMFYLLILTNLNH
jgi:fumarate reductase subunit D